MVKTKKEKNIKEELAEVEARWLRAKADYQNLQKETEKWKMNFAQYAKADMILELLPVYSHYKTALNHIPDEDKDKEWLKGIEHIYKLLQDFMSKMDVSEIKTIDQEFDHNIHEAIKQETNEAKEDNIVLAEIQPGFMLGDRVLQPAKVIVNNLNNESTQPSEEDEQGQ